MSESKFNPTVVASYGAALSTAMLATGVDAAVVSLTANPSTVLPGEAEAKYELFVTGSDISFTFSMDNSSYLGRNIFGRDDPANVNQGVLFRRASFSSTLTAQFKGSNIYSILPFDDSGEVFVGFVTSGGNLGYIQFEFGRSGDARIVSIFANDVAGDPIGVGKGGDVGVVPVPASLPIMAGGMLALGAVGLRKRRKAKAAV